jgi:hypothetical protein
MLIDDPAIVNILIAPGGVVSDIYPLEGNEAVLGLDFFSEGAGNLEARMAKEARQLVLGGPFEGVQGGQIMVGRLPVFISEPDGTESFWGITSVTLAYPQALNGAGLEDIIIFGFDYEVWRRNPDDNEMQLIACSKHEYNENNNYVEVPITILNAEWYFRILTVRSWRSFPATWLSLIAGICVSLFVAAVIQRNEDIKKLKNINEQNILEKHMAVMKLFISSLEQQNQSDRKHRKEAELFRHDLRHIGGLLLFCVDSGDAEEARKLIHKVDETIRNIENADKIQVITGHTLSDAVLAFFTNAGAEAGVTFNIKMQYIDGMKANLTEFAVAFSNAIENAVNACGKIPEGADRMINITGSWNGEQYFVEIANTCAGKVSFDSVAGTPVSNEEGRGLGTQNIAYFAQKHGAVLQYKYEDNWFFLRMLI